MYYIQIIDASPPASPPPAGNPDREGGESLKAVNSAQEIILRWIKYLQADALNLCKQML